MSTDKKAGQSLFTSLFSDSSANQKQTGQTNQNQAVQASADTTNTNTQAVQTHPATDTTPAAKTQTSSSPETNPRPAVSAPPPAPAKSKEVRTIDVFIGGVTYPINCPADEKEELDKAVLYINHFIREIRKDAPTLEHENLLVLCCLNMYEEMKQQKNTEAAIRENDKQMKALIDKITKDAKSIVD